MREAVSPIADRSIVVRIGANVTGLVNGLKTADKAAQDWGNKTLGYVQKNEQNINNLSNSLGLVGAALTGVAVLAVKTFADFDAAMSSVQASTMESAANMDLLRDAAIDAGSRTVYSATEAAGAIEELAKAGVSTADILGGGLDGALDLAASGAIEVGEAAEIAATAMTQFGLGGEDVTHIADLLAAGAGKAQGGVGDLGAALKQAGLVADQTGLSIEETTAGLTAFASAGLIGSDAGTSFKSMLQRLTPQSKEAETLMKELGISAYDAQGQFIGLSEFAGNLQESLRSLTPEQRNAAMATIFGSDAVRAANVLYEQGAAGIEEWTDAVNDQGYAAEQAAIRMDNLKGDLEGLSGSFETALINMGESANGPLREIVQALDGMVDGFNGLSDGAQAATMWIVGGAGLVTLGVAGLGKLAVATSSVVTSLQNMGAISEATAGRMGALAVSAAKIAGVAAGLAAAAVAAGKLVDAMNNAEVATADQFADALTKLADTGDLGDLSGYISDASRAVDGLGRNTSDIDDLGSAIDRVFNKSSSDNVNDWVASLFGASTAGTRLSESFENIDAALGGMVSSGNSQEAFLAFQQLKNEAEAQGVSLDELRDKFPEYFGAVEQAAAAASEATPAQAAYNDAMDNGGASAETYTAALEEARQAQIDHMNAVLEGRDAQRGFEAAIDDAAAALTENGATLDITTEKGRANQEALDAIASSGVAATEAMRENGATQTELQGQMQTTRDRFIEAAGAFGMSADEAAALADQMSLIPAEVTPTIAINDQASGVLDSLWSKFERLDGRTITTNVRTNESTVFTGSGNTIARAGGGPVFGPGTATSDSIPARLSNGEHVLTASDVTKLGGHGAVYALRAAAQAGRGYATGGEVRQYVAPPVYQRPAASAGIGARGGDMFPNATIIAADPSAARKELSAGLRLAMAGEAL
jgi:TP901 family phage tail tape measure protein